MPYKNPDDRAKRDSERSAARRQQEHARRVAVSSQNRFSQWLDRILSSEELESPANPRVSAAPTVLAEHLGVERSYISKLRRGTSPGLENTFKIGIALRECGLAWCSGLYALRMRGFIAEELAVIDTLDRRPTISRGAIIAYLETAVTLDQARSPGHGSLKTIEDRLAAAVAGIAKDEALAFEEWRNSRKQSFGLLGAAFHLVHSGIDPADIDDACSALIDRWVKRQPTRQNLVGAWSDSFSAHSDTPTQKRDGSK